jgi:hypothetical protein
VVVVVHQAECIEQPALLPDLSGKQLEESEPVVIVVEDGLLTITASRDVVDRAGKFKP